MSNSYRIPLLCSIVAGLAAMAACGPYGGETARGKLSPGADRKQDFIIFNPKINPCEFNSATPACNPDIGKGWNLVGDTDQPSLNTCLQPFTVSSPGLSGAVITSHVRFASSTSEVQSAMDFGGRVSGGVAGAVPVTGSIFGDASRTVSANQSALTLMAYTKIEFAPRRLNSAPALTDDALARFDNNGPVAFRNLCGDRYVESVTMGAEYLAVIQMSSSDTSVQSSLKTSLTAALGGSQDPSAAVGTAISAAGASPGAQIGVGGSLNGHFHGTSVDIRIDVLQREIGRAHV